jgi:hypothetical protein
MPKIGDRYRGDPEADDLDRPPYPWRRSRRGNWWRTLPDGRNATIFERPAGSGCYRWCLADSDGPRFSRLAYFSPEAAVYGLEHTLAWEAPDLEV